MRGLSGTLLALLLAPAYVGLVGRVKAYFAGRRGPALLQPYRDLAKLARKRTVLPATASAVFLAGPVAVVAAAVFGALVVPWGSGGAALAFAGDALLVVYALALARFLTVAAALDTGSAFEGMGAAREATFAVLVEPALLLALLALGRANRSASLSGMLAAPDAVDPSVVVPVAVLGGGAFFLALLAEGSRVPFDDPATHLELTMIHEAMVLDHGGPALGAVLYGGMLKLLLFGALVAKMPLLLVGSALGEVGRGLLFVAALALVAIAVGVVESSMARLRLTRVPQLLITANLLAGFALLVAARG